MKKDAKISSDAQYRYTLSRIWDDSKPLVLFVGLNPSTADQCNDDRTVNRCMAFASLWGYGGILLGNLFAYRSKDPMNLYKATDPVGPENDEYLKQMATKASLVVGVWGNLGVYMERSKTVRELLPQMKCLRQNKTGEPAHPLYLPGNLVPIDFTS